MVPELEKPKITEIKVRMDCNGCVQKIKKALYGINGIYDLYIDFPQQKLTIIGWAEPEKIMKAIKKTRKIATICSHTEQTDPDAAQPSEPPPDQETAPPPEAANPPPPPPPLLHEPAPPPLQEAATAEEPPKDAPPPENSPPPAVNETDAAQPCEQPNGSSHPPSGSKDVGEVHVIHHHHPPEYGYRYGYGYGYGGHWNKYQNSRGVLHEAPAAPPPVYVTHSYNTHKPSPYVTEYVRAPPQRPSLYAAESDYSWPTHYSTRMERYGEDYLTGSGSSSSNGNITSIFSDENPNACRVM